jgi:hypothetical protein
MATELRHHAAAHGPEASIILTRFRLLLILALATVPALAAEPDPGAGAAPALPLYNIELVIFRHLVNSDGGEIWPTVPVDAQEPLSPAATSQQRGLLSLLGVEQESTTLAPDSMAEEAPEAEAEILHTAPPPQWSGLAREDRKLAASYGALRRSAQYRPLAYLAWRQGVETPEAAQPVSLSTLQGGAPKTEALTGRVRVMVARYLHLELDLRYVPEDVQVEEAQGYPAAGLAVGEVPGSSPVVRLVRPIFELHQRRRMRSGKLHYFDHPRIGVLALITPYTPPAPPPAPPPPPEAAPGPETAGSQPGDGQLQ